MCGPVAHGGPWFQRARYLSAPFVRPFVVVRRVTGHTVDGSRCSILVVDDGAPIKLLLARLLAGETQTIAVGKVSILGVPALLRREVPNHDLVLARVPQVLANTCFRTGFLRLPWIVDMRVRTAEVAKRRQHGSSKTVGCAYARWRQQGYVALQRREPADLNLFYETMYQPFVSARYGDAAATLSRSTLRQALQRGTIVWVEQDGRPIAAQLLERCGSTLHTIAVGTSLEPAAARATGVLTALKVAASDLAIEAGFEWIDFGGCMPWLADGVLQNKRQWGAELVHRRGLHRGVLAAWPRWTPAAAAFLALAPICRHGETTFSVTTITPWSHKAAQQLALRGIDRLLVVDNPFSPVAAESTRWQPAFERGLLTPGATDEILAQDAALAGRGASGETLASVDRVRIASDFGGKQGKGLGHQH